MLIEPQCRDDDILRAKNSGSMEHGTCNCEILVHRRHRDTRFRSAAHAPLAGKNCPSKTIALVPVSQLIKGGNLEYFGKALAVHAKLLADHGYTGGKFAPGRLVNIDQAKRQLVAFPDMLRTFQFHSTPLLSSKQDAG